MEKSNRENSKVSILVAVYNIEKYISKCIQSLITQSYQNIEIVLVDDNSTDKSGILCDEYQKRDSRIKVIHHGKNKRLSEVRNTGLDNASGEYIVFVDGDDWLADDFVSYMMDVIKVNDSDMAINLENFTSRDKKQVKSRNIEVWSPEKATAELLFPHLSIGAWNKIYKRDFIEKNNLRFKPYLFTAEGYTFICTAAQRANNIAVGYRKVYYYRLNNINSATTKYDIRQSEGALYALKEIREEFVLKTPLIINAIDVHTWLNHFWNIRQIIALNLEKEKKVEYNESIKYVKKYAKRVAACEDKISKKVKYRITGYVPKTSARLKNYIFDQKLIRDVKRYKKIEEEI